MPPQSPIINRGIGQEKDGAVIDEGPPWSLPGDEGEAHAENIGSLSGVCPDSTGDPERHIAIHLRFLRTPLGHAMPRKFRSRLIEHVMGHLAEALAVPDEGVVQPTDVQQAAKLARMEMDYAREGRSNGTGGG